MPVVVDTNVAIGANGNDFPLECAAACASALHDITRAGLLVMDDGDLIFREYKQHLSFAGRPGAGDYFFKWLTDNRYRQDRVSRVMLEEDPGRQGEFSAFPPDPALVTFDRSDRKFVAVVLTHPAKPPVLNATDSDWWEHKDVLGLHGVTIRFVCGEERFSKD